MSTGCNQGEWLVSPNWSYNFTILHNDKQACIPRTPAMSCKNNEKKNQDQEEIFW